MSSSLSVYSSCLKFQRIFSLKVTPLLFQGFILHVTPTTLFFTIMSLTCRQFFGTKCRWLISSDVQLDVAGSTVFDKKIVFPLSLSFSFFKCRWCPLSPPFFDFFSLGLFDKVSLGCPKRKHSFFFGMAHSTNPLPVREQMFSFFSREGGKKN